MDQRDEADSGEQGAEPSDEALAILELIIEAANGCFPCDDSGQSPETDTGAECAPVMGAKVRGE